MIDMDRKTAADGSQTVLDREIYWRDVCKPSRFEATSQNRFVKILSMILWKT
jgi:hypothetical protein